MYRTATKPLLTVILALLTVFLAGVSIFRLIGFDANLGLTTKKIQETLMLLESTLTGYIENRGHLHTHTGRHFQNQRNGHTHPAVVQIYLTRGSLSPKAKVVISGTTKSCRNTNGCLCNLQRGCQEVFKAVSRSTMVRLKIGDAPDNHYPSLIGWNWLDGGDNDNHRRLAAWMADPSPQGLEFRRRLNTILTTAAEKALYNANHAPPEEGMDEETWWARGYAISCVNRYPLILEFVNSYGRDPGVSPNVMFIPG
jgi:hypothetical protein